MPFPRPTPVRVAAPPDVRHPANDLPDERLAALERARSSLWETLSIPGLEGQASLFARLEDLQQAMQAVQQDASLRERYAAQTARLVEACQQTLKRMGQVFAFLEAILSEWAGVAEAHQPESLPWGIPSGNREAAAYRAYAGGTGRGSPTGPGGARFGGTWEG